MSSLYSHGNYYLSFNLSHIRMSPMSPDELKALRLERKWTLRDVATVLGVTTATLSRWERRLAEPSANALEKWESLLAGRTDAKPTGRKPTRRPRGLLPRLAELFLADIKAGLNDQEAGWRELAELNLACEDILSLGQDAEMDLFGCARINPGSNLRVMQQARDIRAYRRAVEIEEHRLTSAARTILSPLWKASGTGDGRGAIVLAGLAEMLQASASLLENARRLLDNDPSSLLDSPSGAAQQILSVVDLAIPADPARILGEFGLDSMVSLVRIGPKSACSQALALELGLGTTAERLGQAAILALGTAWAMTQCLDSAGVSLMTEVGIRRLAESFWEGLGLPRTNVDAKWRQVMLEESEPETEKQQLGMLLWSWPEVM